MTTRNTSPELTSFLRRLAALIGEPEALALAEHFGGDRYDIPKTARTNHKFVAAIGFPAFEKLVKRFGGEKIDIPRNVCNGKTKRAILDAVGSSADVARELNCTVRYVRLVRADAGLSPKPNGSRRRKITRPTLQQQVYREHGSAKAVAAKLGCSPFQVALVRGEARDLVLAESGPAEEVAAKLGCVTAFVETARATKARVR